MNTRDNKNKHSGKHYATDGKINLNGTVGKVLTDTSLIDCCIFDSLLKPQSKLFLFCH